MSSVFSSYLESATNLTSSKSQISLSSPTHACKVESNLPRDQLSTRGFLQLINEYAQTVDTYLESKSQIDYFKLMQSRTQLNKVLSKIASKEIIIRVIDDHQHLRTEPEDDEQAIKQLQLQKTKLEQELVQLKEQLEERQGNLQEQERNIASDCHRQTSKLSFLMKPFTKPQQKDLVIYDLGKKVKQLEEKESLTRSELTKLKEQNTAFAKKLDLVKQSLMAIVTETMPDTRSQSISKMICMIKEHISNLTKQAQAREQQQQDVIKQVKDFQGELQVLVKENERLIRVNKLADQTESMLNDTLEKQKVKYSKAVQQYSLQLEQRESRIISLQNQLEQQQTDGQPYIEAYQNLLLVVERLRNDHLSVIGDMACLKQRIIALDVQ